MLDNSQTRLPIGLCIFGIAYSAGYVGRGTPRANANPLTPNAFLDLAVELGLTSVELTTDFIDANEDEKALLAFRERTQALGLRIVLAGPKIDAVAFEKCFQQAKLLGVSTIRCVISGLLCGDRRPMGGLEGWQRHLAATAQELKKIAVQAADLGMRVGVENHQDATSADLIWLCEEVGSPQVGVVLDTGNPLAVAEDPVEFAQRILPYLVHVHLKDYRLMRTEAGYRLYHCPIGAGEVDFAALFRLFDTKPDVLRHIEMAALGERHIRMLEDDYWAGLGARDIATVAPVLRRREQGETNVEWRTPWELNEEAILPAWEMARLQESVARMKSVLAAGR